MVMILLSFFSSTRGRRSMLSEDDIERELKMLNKPYVISFKIDTYLEGDSQTRFMVFWTVRTADDYQETGCANMLCPGFVLMNQALAPGMALPTGTTVTMDIERDESGNWLVFLNTEMVGYFPGPIVNGMNGGTQVQMGGSVYSPPRASKSPPMGSGVPPLPGPYNGAAKFTRVSFHGPKGFL
ncbi:hypothetical protein ACQ4PT_048691 [Festuca glaucescens]